VQDGLNWFGYCKS
jgi:hypothetical protein